MRFFGDSAEFGTFFPRIPRLACKTALPTHFMACLFFASAYRDAPSCSQNTATSAAPHACGHRAQHPLRQQTTKNPPCESTCGYCGALQALKLLNWCGWRGSNPRPLASEANTLSTELQPHTLQAHGPQIRLGDYGMAWVPRPATCAQRRHNLHCQTAASPHQAPTGSLLGPKPRPAK